MDARSGSVEARVRGDQERTQYEPRTGVYFFAHTEYVTTSQTRNVTCGVRYSARVGHSQTMEDAELLSSLQLSTTR